MVYIDYYDSPVGRLLLAEKNGALAGAWIEGQKYYPGTLREETEAKTDSPLLRQSKQWLERYFAGEKPLPGELKLSPAGSEFQKEVWKLLCEIPYGETTTYGEIAKKMAKKRNKAKMSAQAVGNAVGHNPVSIIVPCHRVIGSDGGMTGYGGGIAKKVWLLNHEGVSVEEKRCVGMKRR